ncbi:MAG: hypothetical protein JST14_10270 [Bacteroidetes bacterium]|nr:hypothetical protein [Bacteroidota bacterium]MBS1978729.1 hypothetical protein [Bacteroidota bacterium]
MERNYDEIIAEMLIQLERHAEELDKHSLELSRHSQELIASKKEHDMVHLQIVNRLKDLEVTHEKVSNNLLEQLVHSATILDRIIKRNDLRV